MIVITDLKERNNDLEEKIMVLEKEIELTHSQLSAFSYGTKKLDHMLGLYMSSGDKRGSGFVKSDENNDSTSKTICPYKKHS